MSEAIKCDKVGCKRDAVYSGHIYGREKGTTESQLLPVNACEVHAKSNGFFESGKVGESSE